VKAAPMEREISAARAGGWDDLLFGFGSLL
jgi:hypothetical protein